MLFHTSLGLFYNSVVVDGFLPLTFSPMIFHRFPIGFKSGLIGWPFQNLNYFIVEKLLDTFGNVTWSIIWHMKFAV